MSVFNTFDDFNRVRFDAAKNSGHVESYFLRANHPSKRLAIWLKATLFHEQQNETRADVWCTFFDGESATPRIWAQKVSVPYAKALFSRPNNLEVGPAKFSFEEGGVCSGELPGNDDSARGPCSWRFTLALEHSSLAKPSCILPHTALLSAPLPKFKLVTPMPLLRIQGSIDVFGETFELNHWRGMQGHNWGSEHSFEYAWGQAHFSDRDADDNIICSVEAFSAKLRLLGRVTPFLSALVVRHGGLEYRFDKLVDLWRQKPQVDHDALSWTLRMRGSDGEAQLKMQARPEEMVCLGYPNPGGRLSYCMNSKLAKVELRVNPDTGTGFAYTTDHGGAFELLRDTPDSRFPVVGEVRRQHAA